MKDAPLQRTLKVGKVSVGLVGLDVALNRVVEDRSLDDDQAAESVFAHISKLNYVPKTATKKYREAILKEVLRLRGGGSDHSGELVIRILGPGCVSCNNIQKMVIEIMNRIGAAADIFQIHDLDEIGRYGVLQTPALIVNDKLKSSGRVPTPARIEEWLREELDSTETE